MTPYERVKLSRERTAGVFPLPSVLDCIRYSLCELCEYDDAWLRLERTDDKRNNRANTHNPYAELGQCAYMLLSAAVQTNSQPWVMLHMPPASTRRAAYTRLLRSLANALDDMDLADRGMVMLAESPFCDAWTNLCILTATNKFDIDALIDDTCAAFEAKHAMGEAR